MAHLSDLHLGHGGSGGEGAVGEIRDADVRDAFLRAVRAVIRLRPDLVVVTGDIFDTPDPSPGAIATLLQGIRSLSAALPGTPLLLLAGARDTPPLPGGEPGPLALLESFPGVEVATGPPLSVHLSAVGVHVLLVPHAALRVSTPPTLVPDPEARWNVLALHALAGGGEGAPGVDPGAWDWVALGGDHRGRSPAPGVRWAGSLERVSGDPWKEAGEERGFLTVDLASGAVTVHPLPGRAVVEVAPIRRGRQDLPRVNARIRTAVEAVPGGIDGRLVRLRVHGLSPRDRMALDGAWLSVVRRRSAQLQLQVRAGDDPTGLAGVPVVPGRRGLRALVGGTAREREALLVGWRGEGTDGHPATPAPEDRPATPGEALIWGGVGPDDPGAFLDQAIRALGEVWTAGPAEGEGRPAAEVPPSPGAADAPPQPDASPAPIGLAEARIRALRADATEVDGEVEALTVEWLRERQDAETQLQSHRDRARELRERIRAMEAAGEGGPCPVCGRPLADHLSDVLGSFREEWDSLVQDGTWWSRRREQLEPKPPALREMEAHGIRLHAELEGAAEEAERLRVAGGRTPPEPGAPPGPDIRPPLASAPDTDDPADRTLLLARGSDLLNRLTEGGVAGVVERKAGLFLVVDGLTLPLAAVPDRAAVRLALHLALVELTLERGIPPQVLRVGGGIGALDPGVAARSVGLLRRLSRHLPGVLIDAAGGLHRRLPEWFDGIVELRPGSDSAGRPLLRLHPGGRVRIRLPDTP